MKAKTIIVSGLMLPLILLAGVFGFILLDSFKHWKTTELSFTEYYELPLALIPYYLLIAYLTVIILLFLILTIQKLTLLRMKTKVPNHRFHSIADSVRRSGQSTGRSE